MTTRDDFTAATKTQLAKRVGYRCSNPSCRAPTSGPTKGEHDRSVNLGVAAHICAASKNGPRFEPAMTSAERMGTDNGIWLCAGCAKKIDDDPTHYTVSVLREWKRQAEEEAHRAVGRPAASPAFRAPSRSAPIPVPAPSPSPASNSAPSSSRRGAIQLPILPHFTSLRDGQGELVVPRDFNLWITPSEPLELTAGLARAAVAAGAGAPGWCMVPFSRGEDISDRAESHPGLGTWVGLWHIDSSEPYVTNRKEARALGISDHGVLAWQHEDAWDQDKVDVVHLSKVVEEVAAFVAFAQRAYRSLDLEPDVRLRLRLLIGTPRPSKTVVEGMPFFGRMTPVEVDLKVTSPHLEARAGFDPEGTEAVELTHKLINQVLASCKASPRWSVSSAPIPSVVTLEEATIREFLGEKGLARR